MFCRNVVLRNFAKFTRKHLFQSLFFHKVVGWAMKKKRDSGTGVLNSVNFLKIPFLTEHLLWMLLQTISEASRKSQLVLQVGRHGTVRTVSTVFRYPFLCLILKQNYSLYIFHMGWNKIPIFCLEISNRFRAVLCRMHVYPAKMHTTS